METIILPLDEATKITRNLIEAECVLYRPRFWGKPEDSDALDIVKKELLDCLVHIEQSNENHVQRDIEKIRNRIYSNKDRLWMRQMIDPDNSAIHQERYRNELIQCLKDIRRLLSNMGLFS